MSSRHNRPTEPPYKVGTRVQLDSQPFVWTVDEVMAQGMPWVAPIVRKGHKDELVREFRRHVDVERLSEVGPDGKLPK